MSGGVLVVGEDGSGPLVKEFVPASIREAVRRRFSQWTVWCARSHLRGHTSSVPVEIAGTTNPFTKIDICPYA